MTYLCLRFALVTIFFSGFCYTTFASEWAIYFKSEQVEVLYKYIDCHDEANGIHQQKILFRFVNLTNKRVDVHLTREYSLLSAEEKPTDISQFSIQLKPNEAKEGSCDSKEKILRLFSRHLNFSSDELKEFKLLNIRASIID